MYFFVQLFSPNNIHVYIHIKCLPTQFDISGKMATKRKVNNKIEQEEASTGIQQPVRKGRGRGGKGTTPQSTIPISPKALVSLTPSLATGKRALDDGNQATTSPKKVIKGEKTKASDKVFQDSDDDLSDCSTASAKSAEFSDVPEKREEQVTTKSDELNPEQGEESISSLSKKMTRLENMVMGLSGQLMEIKEMVRDVILNQLEQERLPTEHVAGGGNEENQLEAIVKLNETVQEKLEEIKVKVGEAPAIQPPALAVEEIYPTAFGIKRTKDMEQLNSAVCVQVKAYLYIFH